MKVVLLVLLSAVQAADPDPQIRIILDRKASPEEHEEAVKKLAKTRAGGLALLALFDQGKLPEELHATTSFACAASSDPQVRAQAEVKLPVPKSKDGKSLPAISELAERTGQTKRGATVFKDPRGANCISCHQIGEEGKFIGPPLNTIGQKLSKEQLYEAILTPSASILMGYENWLVKTKDGEIRTGILSEDTDDHLTLKDATGEYVDIPTADVLLKRKLKLSMMPDGLSTTMSVEELIDLVEYLSSLK